MYLTYGTRLNIAFAVRQLNKHNANPRKGYLKATKRVVQYLKKAMQIKLMFGQMPTNLFLYDLTGYANSNFAGNFKDQKSIMKYYFFFNKVVILWKSKKQRSVCTLTIKAK